MTINLFLNGLLARRRETEYGSIFSFNMTFYSFSNFIYKCICLSLLQIKKSLLKEVHVKIETTKLLEENMVINPHNAGTIPEASCQKKSELIGPH